MKNAHFGALAFVQSDKQGLKKPCSPPRFVFRAVGDVARCFLTGLLRKASAKSGILVRLDGQKTAVYVAVVVE